MGFRQCGEAPLFLRSLPVLHSALWQHSDRVGGLLLPFPLLLRLGPRTGCSHSKRMAEQGRQRPRFLAGGLRRGAPGRWKRRREIAEREELEK